MQITLLLQNGSLHLNNRKLYLRRLNNLNLKFLFIFYLHYITSNMSLFYLPTSTSSSDTQKMLLNGWWVISNISQQLIMLKQYLSRKDTIILDVLYVLLFINNSLIKTIVKTLQFYFQGQRSFW